MKLFSRSRFSAINRFFTHLPIFSKPDKYSLLFLNSAQFMGVLNDNIFKLVIAFLLIEIKGKEHASTILSTAGAIFVIPFLLFSSAAGVLADRFSKQRLMVGMKVIEMLLMSLAIVAFGFKSVWGSYTLLFLLSTHSAMFGPSKYAIIAELVPADKVSRANGLITSFTYLGVIVGTFLASFITEITDRHFVLVAGFCLCIAFIGFISTFGIKYTPPQGSKKKINPLFLQEIFETLRFCKPRKHLLMAIFGSSFFLFIGAYAQLNIIPFAIQSLNLSEIYGGYLFLSTALGIAVGASIAGRVSKTRVELGLPCLAGFCLSFFMFMLAIFSSSIYCVVIFLVLLGVFGGFFVVPCDSFIQLFSPDEKRGQIIAATSFLSFCGVLIASIMLFFYSEVLEISAATGFAVTGFITLFVSFLMTSRLSDLAFSFMSRVLLKPFMAVKTVDLELIDRNPDAVLVLRNATWVRALLLLSVAPKTHLILPKRAKRKFPWFNWMFYSIHVIPTDDSYKSLLEAGRALAAENITPCLFAEGATLPESLQQKSLLGKIVTFAVPPLIYVDIDLSGPGTTIKFTK